MNQQSNYTDLFPVLSQTVNLEESLRRFMDDYQKSGLPDVFEHIYGRPPGVHDMDAWRQCHEDVLEIAIIDFIYNSAVTHQKELAQTIRGTNYILGITAEYKWFVDAHEHNPNKYPDPRKMGREGESRMKERITQLQEEYEIFKVTYRVKPFPINVQLSLFRH